ncbi:transmembrane protein 11, mitochondrial-like isoform X1 [Acropora millepora]|uniref:transmembrane protein 11, mitochondrial-like isoform X1 n=1 Tax=Acropora millepora TaxID=45264 RepID=UPI001CF30E9F|nr:transmembrane protein 11, mitochondrial-like isoform X1 [Acropora millepora]
MCILVRDRLNDRAISLLLININISGDSLSYTLTLALIQGALYTCEDVCEGGCVIIHEIYDSEDAHEQFEADLERALESQCEMIVIEPTAIGEETARWIQVGNCLHKTAVISGLSCFLSPMILPKILKEPVSLSCGGVSFLCAALYGVSWQFDPCCQYQVEYDTRKLVKLPLGSLTSSSPIVLVRKDDKYRKRLQNLIAGSALIYCTWKVYWWYFG